jgi:DNA invertase Pin-like site-specific DNA recombinase
VERESARSFRRFLLMPISGASTWCCFGAWTASAARGRCPHYKLQGWGVGYKSLTEQYLDSVGLFQEAIISILATLAKQERIRLSERNRACMARRRAAGISMGPPMKSVAIIEQIHQLKERGLSNYAISKALCISASTVSKYLITT